MGGGARGRDFGRGGVTGKLFVGHKLQYAVFDIKPTYDHIFSFRVPTYIQQKFFEGSVGPDLRLGVHRFSPLKTAPGWSV